MDFWPVLGIAIGLAMDAFSVAIATGITLGAASRRQSFRLSFHFGLFQFLMPLLGWLVGTRVESYVSAFDHWLAFAILGYIGLKMIRDSFSDEERLAKGDPTRGLSLIVLSVATSIDAFAVGLGLAVIKVSIIEPSVIIGIVAAVMTLFGLRLGKHIVRFIGRRMETVGGLILIVIGVKILVEHLVA